MNKRILVSESEKSSILKMHESFKNRGVIIEQKSLTMRDLHDGKAYSIVRKPNGDLFIVTEDNYEIKIGKGTLNPKDGMVIISTNKAGKREVKGKNSGVLYKTI